MGNNESVPAASQCWALLLWWRVSAVKKHSQWDLLRSYCSELDFKPSLNTEHMSLSDFPMQIVDVSRWREETVRESSFSLPKVQYVRHSHLLALICVRGYAFCERLNPRLSNDAFMLSVSSSPSVSLPLSLSPLIKRMGQYASDIKRHQSPHTVYLRCFLSFMLALSPF